jgi:hypothetical protein
MNNSPVGLTVIGRGAFMRRSTIGSYPSNCLCVLKTQYLSMTYGIIGWRIVTRMRDAREK